MNIKKHLGKRLQEIRKHKKLTQEQVAEFVGIETSSISNIENGKYYPSAENLDKILKILDVQPSEIFAFESSICDEKTIEEMLEDIKKDKKLAKLIYKFYLSVKFL